jgi:hypothetical protein
MAISTARMLMTTRSSIRVKAKRAGAREGIEACAGMGFIS